MKGFNEVTIYNRPYSIVYKGEHYAIRHRSGRTTRMTKERIIKKFHLHADALDRHIGGMFKKSHCDANEDVVRVKRCKDDVESAAFTMKKAIAILVIVVAVIIVAYRQPRMVEIDYIDDTGTYVNYVDHNGDLYKGVYIEDAPLNVQIVAELR